MVLPNRMKQIFSSINRIQWVFIFIIAIIPIVGVTIYLVDDGVPDMEPKDEIEDTFGEVIYVNMIFRHGDRNPIEPFPTDPYVGEENWPGGYGALTFDGILHQRRQGKWIAERYRKLLPVEWTEINDALRVVSTDRDRTIMSAEACLAGMFPIKTKPELWEGLSSYPVPIHTIPDDEDNMLEMYKPCKRYKNLFDAQMASEMSQNFLNQFKNVSDYIEMNTGTSSLNLTDIRSLYTTFYIEDQRGLTLPKWVEKVYPSPLRDMTLASYVVTTWTTEMKRLRAGQMVKEVLNNFRQKLDGYQLNITMYSAHDTSLVALMTTMGVFNNEFPPFSALLLLELRRPKNFTEPAVMIWYRNSTGDPFLLSLPNCTALCPLSEVERLLKPVTVDDWEKECEVTT